MVLFLLYLLNILAIRLKIDIIGMDAWHKSNIYKYPVFVISYVTESLRGGILGIAICDQATHERYEAFLTTLLDYIRKKGGPIMHDWAPIVMIDNDDAEIRACDDEGKVLYKN